MYAIRRYYESVLEGLILERARLYLSIFMDGDAKGLKADEARFEKCVFKRVKMDKASFHAVTTDAMLLHGCAGEKA